MTYNKALDLIADDLNLPKDVVDSTYRAFWEFIRESVEELPLKEELSQEEFNSLRTNINIPSLGKINCTYDRYLGMKARFNIINTIRNKT